MAKCGACGKFLPAKANDSVRCSKCPAVYHRVCVPASETCAGKNWLCSSCISIEAAPCEDRFSTPIKAQKANNDMEGNIYLDVNNARMDLVQELKSLRYELSSMRAEVRQCCDEIADFKATISQCQERVSLVESRVSVIEQELAEKTTTNEENFEETISELRKQLNERDQELLLNDVLVAGIPEERGESVSHVIKLLAAKLGVELQDSDVVNIERIGPLRRNLLVSSGGKGLSADPTAQRPRVIAVRLSRRSTRDCLLRASRVRRVLTTTDIDMPGSQHRIYLNERLTRTNYQLFHRAREAGRRFHWKYIWTKEGKVLAKRGDGTQTHRIHNNDDINKFFGK